MSTVPTTHHAEETEETHASIISTSGFWPQFYAALVAATPRVSFRLDGVAETIAFSAGNVPDYHPNLIHINDAEADELSAAHSWFVEEISRSDFPKPHFIPGSQGIVTTAGGSYLPEVLVAIRMLRRTGSKLPVDVFFATPEEAEPELCKTVLATLRARCHTISELVDLQAGNLPHRQAIRKYQLKVFALLLSDFDDILWLDTDEICLQDPADFFNSEPFISTGLVVWPDYWINTASPIFYHTANITGDRVPSVTDRASSETGQLLISKSRNQQLRTLILAAYYNFHGPSQFYHLLSQGAPGEGDKETFLAAALALDAPFWAIHTPVDTVGAHNKFTDSWVGSGILQVDPRADYARYSKANSKSNSKTNSKPNANSKANANSDVDPASTSQTTSTPQLPRVFIHTTVDKPNAGRYARQWRNGIRARIWQPKEHIIDLFGFDVELARWQEMSWTACSEEMAGFVFRDWIGNVDVDQATSVCEQVREIMAELFGVEGEGEGKEEGGAV